jgi:hypothetical protein
MLRLSPSTCRKHKSLAHQSFSNLISAARAMARLMLEMARMIYAESQIDVCARTALIIILRHPTK